MKLEIKSYDEEVICSNQIMRSSYLDFGLLSENNVVGTISSCKEYVLDSVLHCLNGRVYCNIGPSNPISVKRVRIVLTMGEHFHSNRHSGIVLKEKLENILDLLHQVESELKIRKTVLYKFSKIKQVNPNNTFFVEGSPRWIKSPPMLSFYTLLMRLGLFHEVGTDYMKSLQDFISGKLDCYPHDKTILKRAFPGIKRILKHGDKKIFFKETRHNYPNSIQFNIHGMGIADFGEAARPELMPHWHRKEVSK